MARLFTVGSGLIRKWKRLVSRSYESLDDIKKVQDEIKTGVIPAMISYSVPSFFIDSTKYLIMTRVKCCAAFKYIMPSMASALEPKLQPTRSGNGKIRVSKKFRTKIRYMWPQSKKDGSFKAAEWSSGMRKPQPTGGTSLPNVYFITNQFLSKEIFGAEDDEDDEPASDSDLVLLHQHMGNYIDSDEESDLNPKDPRPSKSSNPSSDKSNEPIPPHSQEYCAANKLSLTEPYPQMSTFPYPTIKLHYPPTRLYSNIDSALAPTVKPYANQLILACTPLPKLLNLPNPLIVVLLHFLLTFQSTGMDLGKDGDDVEALKWMTGMDTTCA
ncbi:hypothetical protein GYMLUDRAFT_250564 [Collybiopsis luxurians FD-317 M1]|uniref:Uncharacterized protein n=1 Tax=Collybiopsis luxurians FD-317 M1 TaxID=944289 RepID=A0A0D0CDU2_9AGAR|nr:hypothetical protein GYMLUDRAFT_250564 [Collybiopsis luxurians FD-317 M1]